MESVPRTDIPRTMPHHEIASFDIGRFGLQTNPTAIYLSRLAPGSRPTMLHSLNAIADLLTSGREDALSLQWWHLRYQHTAAVRSILVDKYAPSTANKMLAALKGCLKECMRLGLMDAESYARATDLQNVKSHQLPAGRALESQEIAALMRVCLADPSAAGYRDAALIAIARAGLRRSEITKLDVSDFDPIKGSVKVRAGKGRQDRLVYLPAGGKQALVDWLKLRCDLGVPEGAIAVAIDRFGFVSGNRITDQGFRKIIRKRGKQAGLESFSPHDFRRTFIGDLLDAGVDIATVQKLAGHSNPATTSRYDRRGEDTKEAAMLLIDLPYQR